MKLKKTLIFAGLFGLYMSPPALAQTPVLERDSLYLTLYENNLALVEDHRRLQVTQKAQNFRIEGVSTQMIPDSLILFGNKLQVHARRFDFDLSTPQKLLAQSIGKTVKFRRNNPASGSDEIIEAKILSVAGQGIIEREGRLEVGFPGTLILEQRPDDFLAQPSLNLTLSSAEQQTQKLALGYLSTGLNWKTTYVLDVNAEGTQAHLRTWANLTNTTTMDFENAQISLSAGRINRQSAPRADLMRAAPTMARLSVEAALEPKAAAEPVAQSNLYLYKIEESYDLNRGETIQLALMAPLKLKTKRTLLQRFPPVFGRLGPQQETPIYPQVELSFENLSERPLPGGLARVYGKTSSGQHLFLGEDRLAQTPKEGKVTLKTGQSFDVSIQRIQTDFQLDGLAKNTYRTAYKVRIKNAGQTPQTVRLEDQFPGDWTLKGSSHKPLERTARKALWSFDLKGEETLELTYEVEVRTR